MAQHGQRRRQTPGGGAFKSWAEWLLAAGVLIVLGAVVVQFLSTLALSETISAIRAEQRAGVERGYRNRAVSCRLTHALGIPLDESCLDSNLAPFFDADESVQTRASETAGKSLDASCSLARSLGAAEPASCSGL